MKYAATFLIGLLLAGGVLAQGHPLYRWVDKNGVVHFGDSVPPQYAGQKLEQLSPSGGVRRVVPAQLSPQQAAEQASKESQAKRQADYDRFLLQTYDSAAQLRAARDERLQLLDSRIARAKQLAERSEQDYKALRERAESLPPTDELVQRLQRFEQVAHDNAAALEDLKKNRAETAASFKRDLKRWQQLHDAQPDSASNP